MPVNQIIIIQDLLISSRLNYFTDCYRHFSVDIMMLYISALGHDILQTIGLSLLTLTCNM